MMKRKFTVYLYTLQRTFYSAVAFAVLMVLCHLYDTADTAGRAGVLILSAIGYCVFFKLRSLSIENTRYLQKLLWRAKRNMLFRESRKKNLKREIRYRNMVL